MDENKKEIAKQAMQALAEIEATTRMEDIVKDNKIEFVIENVTYRVRKPIFAEKQELDTIRRKKYLEFVNDNSFYFKKQWIEKYKAKGIDINAMETKIKSYQGEIEQLLLRLATAEEPKDIETLKNEIYKIRNTQFSLSMEMTDMLSFSIEDQLLVYVNGYTTYLVLEKQIPELSDGTKGGITWKKVYDSYEEFKKSESKVIEQAFMYISYLIYSYQEK